MSRALLPLPHSIPSWSTLYHAALKGGVPQLPLTALNSIVAVAAWGSEVCVCDVHAP